MKCRSGGAGGGTVDKDALENDVVAEEWIKTHGPGDRTLTQGLKLLSSSIFNIPLRYMMVSESKSSWEKNAKKSYGICMGKVVKRSSTIGNNSNSKHSKSHGNV